jgi:hypothetical protein
MGSLTRLLVGAERQPNGLQPYAAPATMALIGEGLLVEYMNVAAQ